ncbi:MAG TPA: hypothetical protein VHC69_31465 [Polyangiaceae bacterium]|nr:hypothetical protein [Polyangiaceae bacterium]
MRQKLASLLLLLGLVAWNAFAFAAPRDKAAQKKIEEAIYTDFLNTDFDGAEGLLLGTIRACEDKCSPSLVAKAWMYVGVIRGSGRNDIPGATEAFTTAMGIDPNVALDNEIATDPVKAAFAKVKAGAGTTAAPPAAATSAPATGGGSFTCAPAPTEIETRRPFPLQCEADDKIAKVELHYKTSNGGWQTLQMQLHEGSFRGTIPCSATQNTGALQYYAEGLDADGETAAAYGSDDAPKSVDVASETTADPPSYPDEQPPARCSVADVGPAATTGGGACGGFEAACGADGCCEEGLTCNDGVCERESKKKKGSYPKNLVGLHFGFDVAYMSSSNACTASASQNDNTVCFLGNETFGAAGTKTGPPSNAAPGKINGGFTFATMRVMASYERLFGALGLEARVGFAFNGGKTPQGGSSFLPVHAEARAKWWLRGAAGFEGPGFRPWLHVGGGVAQVDTKVNVDIVDCAPAYRMPEGNVQNGPGDECLSAPDATTARAYAGGTPPTHVQALKQLGQEFATVGGGVMYAVAQNHGAVLNLNLMIPFPSVSFVFEPSIGYEYAF